MLEDADGAWLVARDVASTGRRSRCSPRHSAPSAIFAERIEVARLPKPVSKPKEEQGAFSLPVSLDISRIELPDIALGAGAGRRRGGGRGEGLARAPKPRRCWSTSKLNIARSDGRAGNIDASIDFAPDDNRLDIDIRASEPPGGIIANLLKLPGEPPVEINVSGSGPAADWTGSGTFAVDGSVITRVDARHQLTDRGSADRGEGRRRVRALHAGKRCARCLPARRASTSPAR